MNRYLRMLPVVFLVGSAVFADEFNPAVATFDELLFHAQRYGTTELKRETKRAASQELYDRGAESLRYLMDHIHIKNIWIRILAQQMVERLDDEEAAPVLLEFLESEHEDTRKFAVYFLGFCDTPGHADRIRPFLDEEAVGGSATRTLGKWRARDATVDIAAYLRHDEERRRVAAANALRDIGDPRAISDLIEVLNDPVFTVRNTAARALASFGRPAEKAMIKRLKRADTVSKRAIVRTLGAMESKKARRSLRRLLRDGDAGVRADARRALDLIESAGEKDER